MDLPLRSDSPYRECCPLCRGLPLPLEFRLKLRVYVLEEFVPLLAQFFKDGLIRFAGPRRRIVCTLITEMHQMNIDVVLPILPNREFGLEPAINVHEVLTNGIFLQWPAVVPEEMRKFAGLNQKGSLNSVI